VRRIQVHLLTYLLTYLRVQVVRVVSDLLAEYRKSCLVEDIEKLKLAICIGEYIVHLCQ